MTDGSELEPLVPDPDAQILDGIIEIVISYRLPGGEITYTLSGPGIQVAQEVKWDEGKTAAVVRVGARGVRRVRRIALASRVYDVDDVFGPGR